MMRVVVSDPDDVEAPLYVWVRQTGDETVLMGRRDSGSEYAICILDDRTGGVKRGLYVENLGLHYEDGR